MNPNICLKLLPSFDWVNIILYDTSFIFIALLMHQASRMFQIIMLRTSVQINLAQFFFLYNWWLLHFKTDDWVFILSSFCRPWPWSNFSCFSIRHSNLCNLLPQSTQKNWKRNEDPWTFQTLESYGLQMIFTLKRGLNELMYFNTIKRKRDRMADEIKRSILG